MRRPHDPPKPVVAMLRRDRVPFAAQGKSLRTIGAGIAAAVFCVSVGTLIGLALTHNAEHRWHGIGAVTIGPWSMAVADGTPEINPYQRARFATSGQIPMALSQGVALTAFTDDAGRKLDRRCSYRLGGPVPPARFWTLGVVDSDGHAMANAAKRTAFTSTDILRDGEGHVMLAIAPDAQPGNWLPVDGEGRFALVLRLYDTAVPALRGRDLRALPVPAIAAVSCP